jgi:anti-anti-sigma factor
MGIPVTTSPPFFSSCRLSPSGPDAQFPVVWLGGEHDIATKDVLAAAIAEAVALDEPAVVIDLSAVQFISATTIGVIVAATESQARRGCSLVLRAPPRLVRRAFDVCGLSDLFDRDPNADAFETVKGAAALKTWVKVPPTIRVDWPEPSISAEEIAPVGDNEPASVEWVRDEHSLSIEGSLIGGNELSQDPGSGSP